MTPAYTDHIGVLRGHLEEIYQALDTATGYHTADDLAREYKNVGSTHRASNLTKRLEQARDRVQGYLLSEEDDDVSEG